MRKSKESLCQDEADCADEYTIDIQEGDLIISATDGVFDNLYNHEILEIISAEGAHSMQPAELAIKIVTTAH